MVVAGHVGGQFGSLLSLVNAPFGPGPLAEAADPSSSHGARGGLINLVGGGVALKAWIFNAGQTY